MGRTQYRLPDTLSASLERAFAGEVAERLPRLLAAADELSQRRDAAGRVVSDAHALASSAAVVGAAEAASAARECEHLLTPYTQDGVVPASVADRATDAAEEMRAALSSWHAQRSADRMAMADRMADSA
jgi:HPt (histidine-containing phosphotransfer) domain-containing protein